MTSNNGSAVSGEDGGVYQAHRDAQSVAEDVTLRDWFAGQALAGLIGRLIAGTDLYTPQIAAVIAFDVADAMMAERAHRATVP
jgi:hypothetical protein